MSDVLKSKEEKRKEKEKKEEKKKKWMKVLLRAVGLGLLWLSCYLIGCAIDLLNITNNVGRLGGAGAGFLFVAIYVLFISSENDY